MSWKRNVFILIFVFSYPFLTLAGEIFLTYDREFEIANKQKEYAFKLIPQYYNVLSRKGYVPSLRFKYIEWKYKREIKRNPDNPFLPFCVAELYRFQNKYQEGVKFYDSAVEQAGMNVFKHTLLLDLFSTRKLLQWQRKEEEKFLELKKDFGAHSLPLISTYFFIRARESANSGVENGIESNVRISKELDPFNPSIRLFYIHFLLLHTRFEFFDEFFAFLHSIFIDFQMRLYAIVFFYNFVFLIFAILLFGFIAAYFIKYFPFIISKVLVVSHRKIPMSIRYFIAITILIIPLIWTIPSIYAVVYMIVLPIAFLERKERWAIQFFIVLLLIVSLFGYFQTKAYSALDPTGKVMIKEKIQKSRYDPYLVKKCDTIISANPKHFSGYFLKGLQLKRGGFFEEAEINYRKAIDYASSFPGNYNNLANVLFWEGKIDSSIEYYSLALEYDEEVAAVHYNIAQAYVRKLIFDKSSEHMKVASQLDFDLISKQTKEAKEKNNHFFIDMTLPVTLLWEDFLSCDSDFNIFPWKFLGLRFGLFSIFLFCFFVLSIVIPRLFRDDKQQCPFCFSPVSRTNSVSYESESICWRCYQKLSKIHSVDIKERLKDKIEMDAKRRLSYTDIFWGLFIPGAGHLQISRIRTGTMFLLVFAVLCSLLIISKVTKLSGYVVFPGQSNLGFNIILILIVLNYLFSLISLFSASYEVRK